jgi:hypothetical protein
VSLFIGNLTGFDAPDLIAVSLSFHGFGPGGQYPAFSSWPSKNFSKSRRTRSTTHSSPRSTRREKDGYESPVSDYGHIGQDANCTCDPAALAERKNANANPDGPDGCQHPHAREILKKVREIVRVRKESTSWANESSDSGCPGDAGRSRSLIHDRPE